MKGGKSKAENKKMITSTLLSVKKRGAGSEKAENKPAKNGKAMKDPNKPNRPARAFFVFMFVGCNIVDLSHFRALEKSTSRTEGSWLLPWVKQISGNDSVFW
ncbi:HMG1/2-like protein [Actinidia eriantha]|uniref:HMG1/2-like protein n=1 Tax=Actinidia eriantha TaxID=165200 RepID=UPI00258460D0|nr:HMG1/2-like protein [Actinidia eriantha]XP_057489158.1 HMG1/2-like protein [Actinidia eriantha]XP_057489159.1 HMG1/2-like protein [Actinidia eriantha]